MIRKIGLRVASVMTSGTLLQVGRRDPQTRLQRRLQ
jgi:hypothetical protein